MKMFQVHLDMAAEDRFGVPESTRCFIELETFSVLFYAIALYNVSLTECDIITQIN